MPWTNALDKGGVFQPGIRKPKSKPRSWLAAPLPALPTSYSPKRQAKNLVQQPDMKSTMKKKIGGSR